MSSLASLLLDMGKLVSGSDLAPSRVLDGLRARGARLHVGHAAEHADGAELVVISSAVPPDNPEVQAAARRGVRIIKHAQALGELMQDHVGVAVAGTHGKSTTTALTAYLLHAAGLDPTLVGGAESLDFGAASRLGRGPHVVVEADEYDRRFLALAPRLAIVTGVEPDHLDYFASFEEIVKAFEAFLGLLPPDGLAVICQDDPSARRLAVACRRVTYGFNRRADYRAQACLLQPAQPARFILRAPDGSRHPFTLGLVGRHNVANACAALAVARELGVDWKALAEALPGFRGTRRRFERLGEAAGVTIVDDYAHHPTAVRLTLQSARAWFPGPLWVAFQPHTTHRTAALLGDFAAALGAADRVFLLPIYQPPGREYAARSVTSADLAALVRVPVELADGLEDAAERLAAQVAAGTLVITMGAGDVTRLGPMVLQRLREGRA